MPAQAALLARAGAALEPPSERHNSKPTKVVTAEVGWHRVTAAACKQMTAAGGYACKADFGITIASLILAWDKVVTWSDAQVYLDVPPPEQRAAQYLAPA